MPNMSVPLGLRPEAASTPRANILLVDDTPANLLALRAILDELDQNLVEASSGEEALIRLRRDEFAVVLLDVQMPGLDGFETAKLIRGESSRHIPIIFLTAFESDRFPVEKAYSLGAVDYLVKPLVPIIVRAKVAGFVELFEKSQQIKQQAEQLREIERRKFDRSVEAQREWFRVTLSSIGDAVITTDVQGLVTFLNPVAQELTGWTEADAGGQPLEVVFHILHEQTQQPVENPVVNVLREGRVVGLGNHTVLVARNGTVKPIDDSAAPIRDSNGTLLGVVLIFRDVTEPRRIAREVRQSEARKSAILETALDCIITMDHEGQVVEFNPAAETTFGYSRADVIGRELASLIIPPSLREHHRLGMAKYLATGVGPVLDRRLELPALRSDGTQIPVELSIARISIDGKPLFTAYLRDISERKRLEQHRTARMAVTQVLAQATTVPEAASGVLRAICESLSWDVGFVWSLDPNAQVLRCLESWHNPGITATAFETDSRTRTFRHGEGLTGRAWESGKPIWVQDIWHEPNFLRRAAAVQDGLHGAFVCPIDLAGQTLGVIEFFSQQIREPDANLLELINTITSQVGQFIERTRAEEQVRQSEQELADFFDNATIGLHWVGPDGIILRANRAELDMLGYSSEEYVGRPITEFHADDDVIGDILKRLQAGDKLNEYPARLRCKDGSIKDVLIDSSVMWKDSQFVHTRCFTRDITDRKKAEQALLESEDKLRLLADTIPQLAWMARPDGHIFWYNRRWYEYTGTTPDQMDGWGWQSVHDPEVLPQVLVRWKASIDTGEPFNMVFPLKGADDQFRPFLTRVNPLRDRQGRVLYWFGTNTDITEQIQAEQALRQSEGQQRFLSEVSAALVGSLHYQSILSEVADLTVPTLGDFCFFDVLNDDERLERVVWKHVDPMKGGLWERVRGFVSPMDSQNHLISAVIRTGKPEFVPEVTKEWLKGAATGPEHLQLLHDLELSSLMSVPMVVGERKLGVLTYCYSASGRRHTIEQLRIAEEIARRAALTLENAKLYDVLRDTDRRKDEFLATLAHELRNPLAPIRNSLQILKMPRVDSATAQRTREMMDRQVHHLVRLVDDLLDVSRVMRGKIELREELVELASVVARAVETAQPLIVAQAHELDIALPPESLLLNADPVRLAQVVANLLTNAAKYTEANGRISLTASREGDEAVLRIKDNGIGIAPEMLAKVFDLFVQVDHTATRSQGGLGIGLTLVKNLVELHDGTVKAFSSGLGKGSEFVIRLPLSTTKDNESLVDGDRDQRHTTVSSGFRVLVVDDNQDAANSLAVLLRLQGHEVQVAHNGPAALEIAKAYRPEMVCLDIGMPGMDGYEVARRLRRQAGLENVVLAAVTGWGQQEDRRRSAEAGFDHHLVKPPDPKALESVLARLKRT